MNTKEHSKYTPMLFQIEDDPYKFVSEKSVGTDLILRDLENSSTARYRKKELEDAGTSKRQNKLPGHMKSQSQTIMPKKKFSEGLALKNLSGLNQMLMRNQGEQNILPQLSSRTERLRMSQHHSEDSNIKNTWKFESKVIRMNKAYLLQVKCQKDKIKQTWTTDLIQKHFQRKIISQGVNQKSGLREIFLISFNEEESQQLNEKMIVLQYYVPCYKRIFDQNELARDWIEWFTLLSEIMKQKQYQQVQKFWLLDGRQINALNQFPVYEKMLYGTSDNHNFGFWNIMSERLLLKGVFNIDKYADFIIKMNEQKTKKELKHFFQKKQNFAKFYQQLPEQQNKIMRRSGSEMMMEEVARKQSVYIEEVDTMVGEVEFDRPFHQLDRMTQKKMVEMMQQLISQDQNKYKKKLKNQQEALMRKLNHIQKLRDAELQNQTKQFNLRIKNYHVVESEEQIMASIQRSIHFMDDEDIQDEIQRQVNRKLIFPIMPSIKLIINYLTIFKCISNQEKKIEDQPKFSITKLGLLKSIPYVVLYKSQLNVSMLNSIAAKPIGFIDFMEFLDIFLSRDDDETILDAKAII